VRIGTKEISSSAACGRRTTTPTVQPARPPASGSGCFEPARRGAPFPTTATDRSLAVQRKHPEARQPTSARAMVFHHGHGIIAVSLVETICVVMTGTAAENYGALNDPATS